MNDLMKQAQVVQEQMETAKKELTKIEVSGVAGAGLVNVVMNGRYDVKSVTIDPNLMTEEKEVLEDLLAAGVNDAVRKLEKKQQERMAELSKKMGLADDFKMPF